MFFIEIKVILRGRVQRLNNLVHENHTLRREKRVQTTHDTDDKDDRKG